MTWRDMAQGNFDAASRLFRSRIWRSSGSRAYYASYSIATGALMHKGQKPRVGFGTWSHDTLIQMTETHLSGGSAAINSGNAIRRLYALRLTADYQPDAAFGKQQAFDAMGLMWQVFRQVAREYEQ